MTAPSRREGLGMRLSSVQAALESNFGWLPSGEGLPEASWQRRHRWLCAIVVAHALVLPLYGIRQGRPLGHALCEGLLLSSFAMLAAIPQLGRPLRSLVTVIGLVSASAVFVHLGGGVVELHFHVFVVIVLVSIYQAWQPLALALGVVIVHNLGLTAVAPELIYNHPAALDRPWAFSALHISFVLAASSASLVTMRLDEQALIQQRRAHRELERLSHELSSAQQIAAVGSWDFNRATRELWWSAEMHRIAGIDLDQTPTVETFLDAAHPDDREEVAHRFLELARDHKNLDDRFRLRRPDGEVLVVDIRGGAVTGPDGEERLIGTCQDVTSQVRLEREIEFRADYDVLTGLPNRSHFLRLLAETGARKESPDGDEPFVICLDLDDFQTVNDTLGHGIGDRVLVEVADRLRAVLRPGDVLARIGGDEFAVLSRGATAEDAQALGAQLLAAFETPITTTEGSLAVHASLGIGSPPYEDLGSLLQHAEIALSDAKLQARGSARQFTPDMRVRLTERARLESELDEAIGQGQLIVQYQPVYDLTTHALTDLEALVRWEHPTRGRLGPGEFIQLAEETGLIRRLGSFVLDRALQDLAAVSSHLNDEVGINVNVSPQQLGKELLAEVPEVLARSGIAPDRLSLEITESTLMDPTGGMIDVLQQLRRSGVKIAIDDFGTGYSSLAYLRQLPIDRLKIDRSFVRELDHGASDEALVATIVELARILDLDTVAEGIESPCQAELLAQLGCVHGQGFYLARPCDIADLPLLNQAATAAS